MNILIACEESQEVCKAFRAKGHNAFSCDIQDCSGGHPEWHIKGDVLPLLNPDVVNRPDCQYFGFYFKTCDGVGHKIKGKWDMIIAHPPCTYLTNAANRYYNVSNYGLSAFVRLVRREFASDFFMAFVNCDCEKKVIENPIGVMSSRFRKPDQIIQPYYFGHPYRKSTCLWLFNVPLLVPTAIVDFEVIHSKGKSGGYSGHSWLVRDVNGKVLPYSHPLVSKLRSKTFPGVAAAMADQWG